MSSMQAEARAAGREATHSTAFEALVRISFICSRHDLVEVRRAGHPGGNAPRRGRAATKKARDAAIEHSRSATGCCSPSPSASAAMPCGGPSRRSSVRGRRAAETARPSAPSSPPPAAWPMPACARWRCRSCSASSGESSSGPHSRRQACSARPPAGTWSAPRASCPFASASTRGQGARRSSSRRTRPRRWADDQRWITVIGVIGRRARMVAFGLIGLFVLRAAIDYAPRRRSAWTARWARWRARRAGSSCPVWWRRG